MEHKYANRKVYFLRDILEKDYYASHYEDNDRIVKTMEADSEHPDDDKKILSHAILDIKDVIIPPRAESQLYDWISYHDLVVIDSTVEDHDVRIPISAGQYRPDNTQALTDEVIEVKAGEPIMFRHLALMQFREMVERARIALDLGVFQHTIGDVTRFTGESSKEVIKALGEIQKSMPNKSERIYVNPTNINYKDESTVREVSALLIRLFKNIKVGNEYLESPACSKYILPAIGQLCFNYSTFISAMTDIKTKLPVGTKLPVIYGKNIYIVQITENPPIPEGLDPLTLTEEDLQKYFYLKMRDVRVNERLELIIDEAEEAERKELLAESKKIKEAKKNGQDVSESEVEEIKKRTKASRKRVLSDLNGNPAEIIVDTGKVARREVIFIPPAIAGFTNEDGSLNLAGMPDNSKGELAHNYKHSVISKPSAIWLDSNEFVYASYEGEMKAGADFISICRTQEQRYAERLGEKKDFIDLIDVFNGAHKGKRGGI